MAADWFYMHAGQQGGPVSPAELHALGVAGRLLRNDLVWKEGMKDWVPADRVKGVFIMPNVFVTAPQLPNRPPIVSAQVAARQPAPSQSSSIAATGDESPDLPLIAGFHCQRFAILAAAAAGMFATFLPWIRVPILGTRSGTTGDGWITLLLFVPAVVLAACGERTQPVTGGHRLGAVIPAGIAAAFGLQKIISFWLTLRINSDDSPVARIGVSVVEIGIGLYLLIAAGTSLVILAWKLNQGTRPGR